VFMAFLAMTAMGQMQGLKASALPVDYVCDYEGSESSYTTSQLTSAIWISPLTSATEGAGVFTHYYIRLFGTPTGDQTVEATTRTVIQSTYDTAYKNLLELVYAPPATWELQPGYGVTYQQVYEDIAQNAVYVDLLYRPPTSGGGGGGGGGTVKPPVVAGSVTEQMTPANGGTVAVADNSARVTLPPGAVDEEVKVTIAPVAEVTQPTQGMVKIGNRVYEITVEKKDGTKVTSFSPPISLTFQYSDDDLEGTPDEDLRVFYWDEAANAWVAIPSTVDPETKTVVGTTDHLTVFALMVKPGMPAMPDIKGHWAEGHVLKLVSLGVVGGYEDGTFKPEVTINREQFAKMVVLAAGLQPESVPDLTFADNESISEWARGYVAAAVKAGIVKGLDGNRFGPAEPVTRAQVATMVVRALGVQAQATSTTFADNADIPSWAVGSVQAAVEKGIVGGFDDDTFKPGLSTTRAQAAKMLSQFMSVRLSK